MIPADHWVLEIVSHGYSIELLQTPQFHGVRSALPPPALPYILSKEVEGLLRNGVVTPVPLDLERSGFYSTYFLAPNQDGGHRPILNLKFFNFIVPKTSFMM